MSEVSFALNKINFTPGHFSSINKVNVPGIFLAEFTQGGMRQNI